MRLPVKEKDKGPNPFSTAMLYGVILGSTIDFESISISSNLIKASKFISLVAKFLVVNQRSRVRFPYELPVGIIQRKNIGLPHRK